MNKIVIICTLLIFSLSAFAQSQKELLPSFTEKGKSYLGFDMGFDGGAAGGENRLTLSLGLKPAVSYQYNLLNRLSVGGKIASTTRLNYDSFSGGDAINSSQSVSGSVYTRYYPFKTNGFFVEGEYIHELNFLRNTRTQHVQKFGINPGYSFMVGKNKNIALDLKMNITYQPNQFGFFNGIIPTPTIGMKVPIGKAKNNTPTEFK